MINNPVRWFEIYVNDISDFRKTSPPRFRDVAISDVDGELRRGRRIGEHGRLSRRRQQHLGLFQLRRLRGGSGARSAGRRPNRPRENVDWGVWFYYAGDRYRRQYDWIAFDSIDFLLL